jgi:hypothetical protein
LYGDTQVLRIRRGGSVSHLYYTISEIVCPVFFEILRTKRNPPKAVFGGIRIRKIQFYRINSYKQSLEREFTNQAKLYQLAEYPQDFHQSSAKPPGT